MNLTQVIVAFGQRDVTVHFRADSKGDAGVVSQMFHSNDYDLSRWPQGRSLLAYQRDMCRDAPGLVVDAGANIGASAVYFHEALSNTFVYAIEPDINNWSLLQFNTRGYANQVNFHGAIAGADGELLLEDPGQSDWGFRTRAGATGDAAGLRVKAICPATLLADPRLQGCTPLIFKVDIEGGEDSLFSGDTAWMARFPVIIIELHDWMLPFAGTSRSFFRAMVQHDFDLVHRGENVFLFNRQILAGWAA